MASGRKLAWRPCNIQASKNDPERHALGPQKAYKTFEDILIILLGSIEVKEWVFLYTYYTIS